MKGDSQVIAHLNAQLANELTAINQYFLHARMLGHWGLSGLAKRERTESIEEMKHAEQLIERILMIDGLPNLQNLHKLLIGEKVSEVLRCDLTLETQGQKTLKEGILHAEQVQDYVSRDLLQTILVDTENHMDWLETQISLLNRLGTEHYEHMWSTDP